MAADDLVTQGARASSSKILNQFVWNIQDEMYNITEVALINGQN